MGANMPWTLFNRAVFCDGIGRPRFWQDYVDYSTLEAKCWGSQKGVTRMHVSEGRVHLVHMYVRPGVCVCVCVH